MRCEDGLVINPRGIVPQNEVFGKMYFSLAMCAVCSVEIFIFPQPFSLQEKTNNVCSWFVSKLC